MVNISTVPSTFAKSGDLINIYLLYMDCSLFLLVFCGY